MAKSQIQNLLFALVVVASAALACAARNEPSSFVVKGRVFCDNCRAGFETPATTYIAGAKVRIACRARSTGALTYSMDGFTDEIGSYSIPVTGNHEHEICESMLLSSPQNDCSAVLNGREKVRVHLSRNNGMASDKRFANALGFQKDTPLPECAQLLKQYAEYN